MNFQQLEYVVAVDSYRHFVQAADKCCVTQATLSMMVKKLEEELGVLIFDRSKQPVVPTEIGKNIIEQAKIVLKEASLLKQIVQEADSEIKGELRLGIIPTLAPYLLPLFLPQFLKKYPLLKLKIVETNTTSIIAELKKETLDVGILATPLDLEGIKETFLFHENFRVFVSDKEKLLKKRYLLPQDIDIRRLWLLEEGHCLREQVINLCELQKQQARLHHLEYEAGSIESLLKIVEMNEGITIIPELAAIALDKSRQKQLRNFKSPVPMREISLVTYRHFTKKRLFEVLKEEILLAIKPCF
jgi:LysR family transcriptional regulator, hydrogen peroxide-inducible genes activator